MPSVVEQRLARAEARHQRLEKKLDDLIGKMRLLVAELEARSPQARPELTLVKDDRDA